MTTGKKTDYLTRESVLKLLSDDEVAKVSTAETAHHLAEGDEYVDLSRPANGVLIADGAAPMMGNVLPRKTVDAETWGKIMKHLMPSSVS